ncbi:16S rRNA (guanine(966)-N(2))-methyltransferase RsmD [bacterium]|nr:MAG: 16S rRNA (guanine(966)-N(2))-methyltransferase RsmD [bacterium]
MRIIAGTARGRSLKCPRGAKVRPTPDRVREAIFSILGQRVQGSIVLDLFAGTGALGLEALSRGAEYTVFVEKDRTALRFLRENIGSCGFEDLSRVVKSPVVPYLNSAELPDDLGLVFVDPPYREREGIKTLLALSKHAKSLSSGLIVYEHSPVDEPNPVPGNLAVVDRRNYGDTSVMFLEIIGAK